GSRVRQVERDSCGAGPAEVLIANDKGDSRAPGNNENGILVARDLVVEYPGIRALDRVDFDLRRGEIHALMGENGAGKSSLINVLSGAVRQIHGTIMLAGRPAHFVSPRAAE